MFAAKNELLTRPSGGFVIPRSLRFRASASAYLAKTFGTAPTSGTTQTRSFWFKRGRLTGAQSIWTEYDGGTNAVYLYFNNANTLTAQVSFSGAGYVIDTNAVFRDPSAWYHIVHVLDSTAATSTNRHILYVNGVVQTLQGGAAYVPQNSATNLTGSGTACEIGVYDNLAIQFLDGYMADFYLIDGQALTPSSFGTTSTTTGVWSPIKYTGTYGNHGTHLEFNSYATQAALGTDTSGNSNTWTVNGCSVTAGVTYDSMIDVPTVTDTGSNYAVLNPLNPTGCTVTAGNLTSAGTVVAGSRSSMTMSAGKWYWEVTVTVAGGGGGSADLIGLVPVTTPYDTDFSTVGSFGIGYYANSAQSLFINGVYTTYGASYYANDVIGIKIDVTNNTVEFLLNNTSQGVINTTLLGKDWVAVHGNRSPQANTKDFNFGQRPFAYTAPTGFKSLNTYNLAAASILKGNLYMDATTYTGTGATQSITSLAMQPDFTWLKARSSAENHRLFDSVRGVGNSLISNATNAEASGTDGVSAFNSNGFTLGTNSGNNNAVTYVSWNWKGGGAAVSNTSGSITSSVSANTTSGFSVVTYTGTGANATVGHGLGIAPSMVITKGRDAVPNNWGTWHTSLGALGYLYLNNTTAAGSLSTFWNSAVPTSSVFSLGSETTVNTNTKLYVAYCFAPIAGYSAFGSYVANNSADGPFVYLGFRPRFIMFKDISGAADWEILDTTRSPYNLATAELKPNTAGAETTATSIDYLSNGFKLRAGATDPNNLTHTYIYAAFAENPFNNSLAR